MGAGRAFYLSHPQSEPPASRFTGERCGWNTTDYAHARKFLRAQARFVRHRRGRLAVERRWTDVGFWGEWEAPTRSGLYRGSDDPLLPARWHRPLLDESPVPEGAHATDPWVFGAPMLYYVCQQRRSRALRDLEPGDVLFFGSLKRNDRVPPDVRQAGHVWNFMLDTVFVVAKAEPYRTVDELHELLPPGRAVSRCIGDCLAGGCTGQTFYEGMMHKDAAGAPFSWVPASKGALRDAEADRFPRPFINHVLGEAAQSRRVAARELTIPADEAWYRVVAHCQNVGLELAAELRLPTS